MAKPNNSFETNINTIISHRLEIYRIAQCSRGSVVVNNYLSAAVSSVGGAAAFFLNKLFRRLLVEAKEDMLKNYKFKFAREWPCLGCGMRRIC